MKPRTLAKILLKAVKTFPAIVVTGPRQSGKTTLLKTLFSKSHRFVSLESPEARIRAKNDPISFLQKYNEPVILDEIQYAPELLSYIKVKIDQNRKPGRWLFTGSQHFPLMQGLSESLAGRIAVLSLLPFSYAERINNGNRSKNMSNWLKKLDFRKKCDKVPTPLSETLLRGNYPEIASKKSVDRQLWCGSYISTYLERDVRNLTQIGDLSQFERFLKLCAVRTGQILNLSSMAQDIGVSVPTAKRWLSILETGYLVHLLYPYYRNIGKRLIKSPKLYFCDTSLASYLLGIQDKETLLNSPNFGNLFETMIVTDFLKRFLHFGEMPSMYYMRTRDDLEIDLVLELNQKLHLFEIKSAMTIFPKHAASLQRVMADKKFKIETAAIISNSPDSYPLSEKIINFSWKNILCD